MKNLLTSVQKLDFHQFDRLSLQQDALQVHDHDVPVQAAFGIVGRLVLPFRVVSVSKIYEKFEEKKKINNIFI